MKTVLHTSLIDENTEEVLMEAEDVILPIAVNDPFAVNNKVYDVSIVTNHVTVRSNIAIYERKVWLKSRN